MAEHLDLTRQAGPTIIRSFPFTPRDASLQNRPNPWGATSNPNNSGPRQLGVQRQVVDVEKPADDVEVAKDADADRDEDDTDSGGDPGDNANDGESADDDESDEDDDEDAEDDR